MRTLLSKRLRTRRELNTWCCWSRAAIHHPFAMAASTSSPSIGQVLP